jgi:hypothetical protein
MSFTKASKFDDVLSINWRSNEGTNILFVMSSVAESRNQVWCKKLYNAADCVVRTEKVATRATDVVATTVLRYEPRHARFSAGHGPKVLQKDPL